MYFFGDLIWLFPLFKNIIGRIIELPVKYRVNRENPHSCAPPPHNYRYRKEITRGLGRFLGTPNRKMGVGRTIISLSDGVFQLWKLFTSCSHKTLQRHTDFVVFETLQTFKSCSEIGVMETKKLGGLKVVN